MIKNIIAEVSILPVGTADTGLSRYIAACLSPLKEAKGLRYEVTAMGTNIQGPWNKVMAVIARMHQVPFDLGVQRVITTIRIDDRRDKDETLEGRVERVVSKK